MCGACYIVELEERENLKLEQRQECICDTNPEQNRTEQNRTGVGERISETSEREREREMHIINNITKSRAGKEK